MGVQKVPTFMKRQLFFPPDIPWPDLTKNILKKVIWPIPLTIWGKSCILTMICLLHTRYVHRSTEHSLPWLFWWNWTDEPSARCPFFSLPHILLHLFLKTTKYRPRRKVNPEIANIARMNTAISVFRSRRCSSFVLCVAFFEDGVEIWAKVGVDCWRSAKKKWHKSMKYLWRVEKLITKKTKGCSLWWFPAS